MSNFVIQQSPVPNPVLTISHPPDAKEGANITFYTGPSEMLKVTSNGFYVRGKKLPIDEQEAESVYQAFREFLIWSALTRN
jgi:hypothetical protein